MSSTRFCFNNNICLFKCIFLTFLLVQDQILSVLSTDLVEPNSFIIWGPGLKAVTLPVRYFFIQPVDENGANITHSIGKDKFTVTFSSPENSHIAIRVEILDRQDGSYMARFRQYRSYYDLTVNVAYDGKHIGRSPYFLQGLVAHEECDCPTLSLDEWLKNAGCPAEYEQLTADMSKTSAFRFEDVYNKSYARFNSPYQYGLTYYVIKDNKVYRKTLGAYVGFKMFVDSILLSLTRKVVLPDVAFVMNLGDWPLSNRRYDPLPIVSWCGNEDYYDLILPTYDLTGSTLDSMHRVTLDMLAMEGRRTPEWSKKENKAIFRGRDSSRERLELVRLSGRHPDLIDAQLTHIFFFKDEKDLTTVPSIPFFDFFKYKYQINMDGTVAAYRFPYLLAGGSVIFKQHSDYYEHFYRQLKPNVHYVPLKRDISDLLEKLEWAKHNDDKVKKIADEATKFAQENLLPKDIFCYHVMFFKEYAKKQLSKVEVLEGMENVPQKEEERYSCRCPSRKREEL